MVAVTAAAGVVALVGSGGMTAYAAATEVEAIEQVAATDRSDGQLQARDNTADLPPVQQRFGGPQR